jgi:putative membrane protein
MGYGYGGGFMWLIVLVLVGVVIYFWFQVSKSKGSDGSIIETPLDILKKRYAKGEIDKEEFDRKKKTWNHKGLFNLKQLVSLTS